jgi:hypothetical protein
MQTTPQNKFKAHHIPYSPSQKQKRHSTIETHLKIIPKTLNRPRKCLGLDVAILFYFNGEKIHKITNFSCFFHFLKTNSPSCQISPQKKNHIIYNVKFVYFTSDNSSKEFKPPKLTRVRTKRYILNLTQCSFFQFCDKFTKVAIIHIHI